MAYFYDKPKPIDVDNGLEPQRFIFTKIYKDFLCTSLENEEVKFIFEKFFLFEVLQPL